MKKQIVAAFLFAVTLVTAAQAADNLTVSFHKSCPGGQAPESVPIAAILGKLAIGVAADWVGAMIKAQGTEQTATLGAGTSEGAFYLTRSDGRISRNYGCISLIGWDPASPSAQNTPDEAKAIARIAEVMAPKANQVPSFYADFEIVSLPGRQDLFALRTLTLYLGKSGISGWTNHKRSVTVALSFNKPGDADKLFASTKFQFPDLPIGKFISREDEPLFRLSSGWLQSPTYSDAEKDTANAATNLAATILANQQAVARERDLAKVVGTPPPAVAPTVLAALRAYCGSFKPAEKGKKAVPNAPADLCPPEVFAERIQQARLKERFDEAKLVAVDHPVPVHLLDEQQTGLISVTAAVSETRDASKFWAAMSSAYDSQKADLTQAVARKLIPSERRSAEAAEKAALIEAENKLDDYRVLFEDAKTAVVEKEVLVAALTEKSTESERVKANAELTKAKIKANQAARLAQMTPLPYPELDF